MAKTKKRDAVRKSTKRRAPARNPEGVDPGASFEASDRDRREVPDGEPGGVFSGFVRHGCGWVNVSGKDFIFGAGCPRCGERIVSVEKLSRAEVKELGLSDLEGAALGAEQSRQALGAELGDEGEDEGEGIEDEDEDDEGGDDDEDEDDEDDDGEESETDSAV